ncbi:MAG: hypothetical protein LJE95_14135 [Acidobacteria bacterium]|nr:hypothetical protein [Acidobacteriota bacterium]
MRKSLLYSLFGLGKLPRKVAPSLEGEGIVLLDEGVPGTVTLENFRAPGRYTTKMTSRFSGSLVITEVRFAAFTFSRPIINVGLTDERLQDLDVSVPAENVLVVAFDVARFHEGWSGSARCRFSTPNAREYLERLQLATSRT